MIGTKAQVREVTESAMNELVMNEARLLESPEHEVKSTVRSHIRFFLSHGSTILFHHMSTSTIQVTDHLLIHYLLLYP